jgi:hypothetical protein
MTAPLSKERIAELRAYEGAFHYLYVREVLDAYEALQAERDSLLEAKRVLEYNCELRQSRAELAEAERDRYREALEEIASEREHRILLGIRNLRDIARRALSGTDGGGT